MIFHHEVLINFPRFIALTGYGKDRVDFSRSTAGRYVCKRERISFCIGVGVGIGLTLRE